jgi:carbon starvation protein
MNLAWTLLACAAVLVLGYIGWGRLVARLAGVDPRRTTPATARNDGADFVPARGPVLLGHHFASIAAAGPIVGPTLALGYGWAPALLWILLGVVFIGATHDFLALFMSVREGGSSVAEVARRTLGRTGFVLFVSFALLLCIMVVAAFLDLTALALTSTYRLSDLGLAEDQSLLRTTTKDGATHGLLGGIASTSVIAITLAAPLVGWLLVKRRAPLLLVSLLSLGICAGSIALGFAAPVTVDPRIWMGVILAYSLVASAIPIWLVLQPRDFVNVHLLYVGMGAMLVGITAAGLKGARIDAPAFGTAPDIGTALGAMWPFLFVTVACGSVSGAHALIAGGTTSKQVASEAHIRPVGYGGMLMEALLGVCVTLIILGGIGFARYNEIVWPHDEHGVLGRGNAPLAFAAGVGGILHRGLGLEPVYGTIFGILLLEGFLVTTVDTIVRLQRYLVEELWATLFDRPPALLRSALFNTALPLVPCVWLAYGQGYKEIWPVFGSANQLLAALTLVAASFWLYRQGRRYSFAAWPAAFMMVTTIGSLVTLAARHLGESQPVLATADLALLGLAGGVMWLVARQVRALVQGRATGAGA